MEDKVEIHSAYVWDCGKCGHANFQRCISREPTDEEFEEMKEDMGLPWHAQKDFMKVSEYPESVDCQRCRTVFETIDPEIMNTSSDYQESDYQEDEENDTE